MTYFLRSRSFARAFFHASQITATKMGMAHHSIVMEPDGSTMRRMKVSER